MSNAQLDGIHVSWPVALNIQTAIRSNEPIVHWASRIEWNVQDKKKQKGTLTDALCYFMRRSLNSGQNA